MHVLSNIPTYISSSPKKTGRNVTVLFDMHVSSFVDYVHPKARGYPTSQELLLLVSSFHRILHRLSRPFFLKKNQTSNVMELVFDLISF
jgi:hypothetical protein